MKKLALALLALPLAAYAQLDYTVEPDVPAKSIRVAIAVKAPGDKPQFKIPAWCPGWYVLTESEKKVSDVRATGVGGKELKVDREDPHTWRVQNPGNKPIIFSYRVLGDEGGLGSDYVHVDDRTTFVNSPAALMYLQGRLRDSATLKVKLPEGWDVATALDPKDKRSFAAKDYDELIDCPIQMGILHRKSFKVRGIPFEAVFAAKQANLGQDLDYETERLRKVSEPAIDLFGGAPFKRYTYIVHLSSDMFGGGGLEHRSCTVLDVGNYKPLGMDDLASHELFHAWNVKQIRPRVLGPFDYSQPCRTKTLWFLEGVTDYYGSLNVYRSGLCDDRKLLARIGFEISSLQHSGTRLRKTLDEACWETWEHGGFGYDDLSYYTKGHVVGILLDAAIREATGSAKSLDDVMRYLYGRYRLPNPGYDEDGILLAINRVAGKDLTPLYRRMMQSTQELPYERLGAIGLRVLEPDETYEDTRLKLKALTVDQVTDEQAAKGLKPGDRVVEIRRTDAKDTFEAIVERGTQKLTLTLPLKTSTNSDWRVVADPFAPAACKQRLAKWLKR